jgi:hypothetical protein
MEQISHGLNTDETRNGMGFDEILPAIFYPCLIRVQSMAGFMNP